MSWSWLPPEIRREVFQHLEISKRRLFQSPRSHRAERWGTTRSIRGIQASYAAVNREWQYFFEEKNFEYLILDHSDVRDFGDIMFHREHLVRGIWLRVQLDEYGCDKCSTSESEAEIEAHESRFSAALWKLLYRLSKFDAGHPGVSLELSAHSPSDSEHHLPVLGDMMSDTIWEISDSPTTGDIDDETHGWSGGRSRPLRFGPFSRIFGPARGFRFDPELAGAELPPWKQQPTARVVKELIIRLQFYRHISIRGGLSLLVERLPELEKLTYECRKGYSPPPHGGQGQRQREHRRLFDTILQGSTTMKSMVLHELRFHTSRRSVSTSMTDQVAGRSLRLHSGHLEELFVSWMVEAKDFFHPFLPGCIPSDHALQWPNLKNLFLTTAFLSTSSRTPLLEAAASTAELMPKLQQLELRGRTGNNRFIYAVQDRQHTIFLPCHTFDDSTIQSWQRVVARRDSSCVLRVMDERDDDHETQPLSIVGRSASPATVLRLTRAEDRWLDSRESSPETGE